MHIDPKFKLLINALIYFNFFILIIGLSIFLSAWTLQFWEGWTYLTVFFILANFEAFYLIKKDPDLLRRRIKAGEKEQEQKKLNIGYLIFFIIYLIPGLDRRFNWSNVPIIIIIVADLIAIFGIMIFFRVLLENSYASHVIEIEKGKQRVITTGPYKIVRHPMYLGATLIFGFTPLSLGSFWGLIPSVLFCSLMIPRIIHEERFLIKELEGYLEYTKKTKYRLIPGIW